MDYDGLVRNYLLPAFGDRKLASIRPLDVSAFVAKLTEAGTGEATIAKAVRLGGTIFGKAELGGIIARNPFRGARVPNGRKAEMHFASADEVARLADAIGERHEAFVYLLAYGGLRIGEAAALHESDLDLLRGRVTVSKAATEVNGHLAIGPTKTGRSRTIALPTFLRQMLARHLERGSSQATGRCSQLPRVDRSDLGTSAAERSLLLCALPGCPMGSASTTSDTPARRCSLLRVLARRRSPPGSGTPHPS